MSAILISIRPEWVAKILNGEKTLEIRNTITKDWVAYLKGKGPKPEPKTAFIYCTKSKKLVEHSIDGNLYFDEKGAFFDTIIHHDKKILNGKVVTKFTLREVELIYEDEDGMYMYTDSLDGYEMLNAAQIGIDDIGDKYYDSMAEGHLYALHISDLVIFDKPKELSEFGLKRAPQSWQHVEVQDD